MNYPIISFVKIPLLMFSILCRRICLSPIKSRQWRKKWLSVSMSKSQGQIEIRVSKKLCLNLCSLKWLSLSWSLVKKIIPFMLLALYRLLPEGLTKDKMCFLNTSKKGEFRVLTNNLLHSISLTKKRILKEFILERKLRNDIVLIWSCLAHYVTRGDYVKQTTCTFWF